MLLIINIESMVMLFKEREREKSVKNEKEKKNAP